jgi:hypothetical protein
MHAQAILYSLATHNQCHRMDLDVGYVYGDVGRYSWDEGPLSHRSVPSHLDSMSYASSPGNFIASSPLQRSRDHGMLDLRRETKPLHFEDKKPHNFHDFKDPLLHASEREAAPGLEGGGFIKGARRPLPPPISMSQSLDAASAPVALACRYIITQSLLACIYVSLMFRSLTCIDFNLLYLRLYFTLLAALMYLNLLYFTHVPFVDGSLDTKPCPRCSRRHLAP